MKKKCPALPLEITDKIKYLATEINCLIKKEGFIPTLEKLIEYNNPITIYVDHVEYKIPEDKDKINADFTNSNNLYFTKVDLTLDKPINEVHVYLKKDYKEEKEEKGGLILPNPIIEKPTNYYFYGDSKTFPMIKYSVTSCGILLTIVKLQPSKQLQPILVILLKSTVFKLLQLAKQLLPILVTLLKLMSVKLVQLAKQFSPNDITLSGSVTSFNFSQSLNVLHFRDLIFSGNII